MGHGNAILDGNRNIASFTAQRADIPGCTDCIRKASCPGFELARADRAVPENRIAHPRPAHQGQTICTIGDPCNGIYIVRSGSFKSFCLDEHGQIQVLGFHLPGEIFGINGILTGRYSQFVEALGTASVCKIPLTMFNATDSTTTNPDVSLLRIIGQVLTRDHKLIYMLGRMTAQRKFAYFLVDLVDRLRLFGVEQGEFTLSMSRADIANYLGLAIETISRLFTQLHARGLVDVNRRQLRIRNMHALRAIANDRPATELLLDKAG